MKKVIPLLLAALLLDELVPRHVLLLYLGTHVVHEVAGHGLVHLVGDAALEALSQLAGGHVALVVLVLARQLAVQAAADVVGHPVHMTGCGRTDAGVHARVYVANFRTSARIPCDRIPYALNTHLPEDIVVTDAMEVHEDFNAIGSCVKKEYTYLIYNSGIRDPFYVNRAWFYPKHLNEKIMQRAADCFIGTHDFAAVRSVGTDVKSTVRTVYDYKVERDGDLISLRVSANGFLYNMARAMAGTCVYAAEGKFPPEAVAQILLNGDRTAAGPTVPPGGLYMTQLWYDDGRVVFHVG